MIEKTGRQPGPTSTIARILFRRGVPKSEELDRILELPRRTLDVKTFPDLSSLFVHTDFCGVRGCDLCAQGPARLMPAQSAALWEAEQVGGAFLPFSVGGGKTLLSLLLFDVLRAKKGVLLVPPDVRDQLIAFDIPRYARHFRLPLDKLTVVAYNQLSDPSTPKLLFDIAPDTIVPDEAHCLRRRDSARTGRVLEYAKQKPGTAWAFLSGTFTNGSVRDYAHMLALAFGKRSPAPTNWKTTEDWCAALDRVTSKLEPMTPGALLTFCTDEERAQIEAGTLDAQEAAREGFRRRLHDTQGVVASYETDVGASLILRRRELVVPDAVRSAIVKLESTWQMGDEEVAEAARMAAFARQLACGFWYRWVWPGGVPDKEWLDARKAWNKAVRDQIRYGNRADCGDTQALVERSVRAGRLPRLEPLYAAWQKVADRPEPPKEAVWIDRFLVEDALEWMRQVNDLPGGGIVWFAHKAIEFALREAGVPVFAAGDSEALNALSQGTPEGSGAIACSINAHRKGKNLQHRWSRALFACCPATAEPWEQSIGREHRKGQPADEVVQDVYLHTDAVQDAMNGAFMTARYVEQTQGQKQKILYARKIRIIDPGGSHNILDESVADE